MFNSPTNQIAAAQADASPAERLWDVDRHPLRRLVWLFTLMLFPLCLVTGRLYYLQGMRAVEVALPPSQISTTHEPAASRDGRILAADGRILAYDVDRYHIRIHYRWLEEPPNLRWLAEQAISQLSKQQKPNKKQLAVAKQNVMEQREQVWKNLAALSGSTELELSDKRKRIQLRVEQILENVKQRRQKKQVAKSSRTESPQVANIPWWKYAWNTVAETLTTPPQRNIRERLVIKEELADHIVIEYADEKIAQTIQQHSEQFPGVRVQKTTQRIYPQGAVAAHVIGYRTALHQEDISSREKQYAQRDPLDYHIGDRKGKMGVERIYDRALHGLSGRLRLVKDHAGEILNSRLQRKPQFGHDLILTLNFDLQQQLEQHLDNIINNTTPQQAGDGVKEAGAAIVVMNVQTGALLAAVSAPRFDLQQIVHPTTEEWEAITSNKKRPLFNRVTRMAIAPGSVFKTLSAVALLQSNKIDPDQDFYCQGYLDKPTQHRCYIYRHFGVGHQDITLNDALSQSCNVYFFNTALKLGPQPLVNWAGWFGFGKPTGIDLPGESAGNLPSPAGKLIVGSGNQASGKDRQRPRWYPGETLGLAIGQAKLTVTPLQIACMMAAIANGGYLVTPHVVQGTGPRIVGEKGDRSINISPYQEPRRIPALTAETLQRVREGLKRVVAHPQGTGYKTVRLKEIAIAGKTGTAEVGANKKDHAWFAGYVPADAPKYAFVVVLEHAGSGGKAAGPVAKNLVETMLKLELVTPTEK